MSAQAMLAGGEVILQGGAVAILATALLSWLQSVPDAPPEVPLLLPMLS